MKRTTYFPKITTQTAEKYPSEGRKIVSTCLLICSPARFVSAKKLSGWVYWKVFCRFWQIKPRDLSQWCRSLLFFWELSSVIPLIKWLQDFSQIKRRRYIFVLSIVCWRWAEVFFLIERQISPYLFSWSGPNNFDSYLAKN